MNTNVRRMEISIQRENNSPNDQYVLQFLKKSSRAIVARESDLFLGERRTRGGTMKTGSHPAMDYAYYNP
jgi:hypothetical protein